MKRRLVSLSKQTTRTCICLLWFGKIIYISWKGGGWTNPFEKIGGSQIGSPLQGKPIRMVPTIVGFPPNHPFGHWVFPLFSPSILGYVPLFWKHPSISTGLLDTLWTLLPPSLAHIIGQWPNSASAPGGNRGHRTFFSATARRNLAGNSCSSSFGQRSARKTPKRPSIRTHVSSFFGVMTTHILVV